MASPVASPVAGLTSTRSNRDVGVLRAHADGLRDHPPSKARPSTAKATPQQNLEKLIALRRSEFQKSISNGSVRRPDAVREPPPLAAALEEAGLKCYVRRLVDDYSCSTVSQLLALDPTSLDALIDALRPLPGHRVRLLEFVDKQREKLGRDGAKLGEAPTAEQQREWRSSVRALRQSAEKRGSGSDVHHQQQPGWLKPGGFDGDARAPSASKKTAYVTSVRVLKVGGSRVLVYDGPKPNAKASAGGGDGLRGTLGLSSTIGSEGLGGTQAWETPGPAWAKPQAAPPKATKPSLASSLGSAAKGSGSGAGAGRGPTTNASGFAENLAGALHVDWSSLSSRLPTGKDAAAVSRRKALWTRADPNGNGYLSSAEVDLMVREAVGEELFSAKPVIQLAFHAARRSGGGEQTGTKGDYVERKEFRTLLVALRQYYELYAMFNRLDTTDDRRIDLGEFRKGLGFVALWGVDVPDDQVETVFAAIDTNGGGYVLFDEFAKWAIAAALDLEDDDDFEDDAAASLEAEGYVAASRH